MPKIGVTYLWGYGMMIFNSKRTFRLFAFLHFFFSLLKVVFLSAFSGI